MHSSETTAGEWTSCFYESLPEGFRIGDDPVELRLLKEYGAAYVARGGAVPPPRVVFRDEAEVREFQDSLLKTTETLGGFPITLQAPAMAALLKAIAEACRRDLGINPRGADSGARDYDGTVELWASRVEPALDHWVSHGRLGRPEAERIRSLSPFEQVPEVLRLEEEGIYFAKDLSKSIIYSVAPPGTSQHLAMLAFDVREFDDAEVRRILANHGWFQTVSSDLPHFTYLGATADKLPTLGLKAIDHSGRTFWVPDI